MTRPEKNDWTPHEAMLVTLTAWGLGLVLVLVFGVLSLAGVFDWEKCWR